MTTATDIQQGTRRTISGTVQNPREDGHGHYLIDLQGTGWTQDKYAVTAFQVGGQETLAALPVGRHIEVIVEAQQKREGKDGSRERDWYWRIKGPADGTAPAAEPAPAPQDTAPAASAPQSEAYQARKRDALAPDPRGNSIERQVAAKAATDLMGPGVGFGSQAEKAWDGWFDHILGRIQGTAAPDTSTGAGHLVQAARDMGAIDAPEATDTEHGAMEPDIDETQAPTDVDKLPF